MNKNSDAITELFRNKFAAYRQRTLEGGEEYAFESMLEGYPERQKSRMGRFIDNASLAEGFAKAIPTFKRMGMNMEVIDISTPGKDAALEIQRTCPVLALCLEYGLPRPCHVICEMDVEATRRAFPDMKGDILCTQADGASVCVFKYERPSSSSAKNGQTLDSVGG